MELRNFSLSLGAGSCSWEAAASARKSRMAFNAALSSAGTRTMPLATNFSISARSSAGKKSCQGFAVLEGLRDGALAVMLVFSECFADGGGNLRALQAVSGHKVVLAA